MLIFTSTLYNHSCRGVFVPLPTSLVLTVVFHQPLDGLPILYGHSCFNDYHHETVKMYLATNIIIILIVLASLVGFGNQRLFLSK